MKPSWTVLLFVVLLLATVGLSLSLGSYEIRWGELLSFFSGRLQDLQVKKVLLDMRLKRVLTAVSVGALLGSAGAAMQSALRNPLASPFTLGVQHAAALGAAIALMVLYGGSIGRFSIEVRGPYMVASLAFLGAVLQIFLILVLAYRVGVSVYAVILIAIAMAFLTQALLSLLQYIFLNEIVVAAVVFWTFGDTSRASWGELLWICLAVGGLLVLLLFYSLDLDLLSVSDEVAESSGVKVRRARMAVLVSCALGTALTVSFVGIIGFVGLVAGQMARLIGGWSNRKVIPLSGLIGALTLSVADLLGRTLMSPTTIPVGIMTSLIGAPVLIYLLLGGSHAQGVRC
ncbi:MAG: iron ABC transporter permease [Deltaproteobacteria bacterium]|nr:MAG: iron ABC transporter permease [Deltaproteobacteria bacterium]